MGKTCCGASNQKVQYEFGPDGKKRLISVKNVQVLEKYG